jgi:hypothetical protein
MKKEPYPLRGIFNERTKVLNVSPVIEIGASALRQDIIKNPTEDNVDLRSERARDHYIGLIEQSTEILFIDTIVASAKSNFDKGKLLEPDFQAVLSAGKNKKSHLF